MTLRSPARFAPTIARCYAGVAKDDLAPTYSGEHVVKRACKAGVDEG